MTRPLLLAAAVILSLSLSTHSLPIPTTAPITEWKGLCACVFKEESAASGQEEWKLNVMQAEGGKIPFECDDGSKTIARGCVHEVQGWQSLALSTEPQPGMSDERSLNEQMFAAGMVEGALTAPWIVEHHFNVLAALLSHNVSRVPEGASKFLVEQHEWAREEAQRKEVSAPAGSDEARLWEMVGGLVAQVDGVVEGMRLTLRDGKSETYDLVSVLFAAGAGDVPAILSMLNVTSPPDYSKLTPEEVEIEVLKKVRCSALVRLTPDKSDLLSAHSTWWNFGTMLRVFKRTNLPVPNGGASKQHDRFMEAFSSYPGVLSSQDDFYVTSRNMVILQTTNTVYREELFKLVKPQSLLSWHRVRLANAMARDGPMWAEIFRVNASGTYPNQYMVVDYSLFTPGQPLPNHTLTVVEEIPGLIVSADETQRLREGFWPSYNIPYFPRIYNESGCVEFAKEHGSEYSYTEAARGKIFARDAPKVTNYQEFQAIMRSNDYKNDPLSMGDPVKAICGRGDLVTPPRPVGCIDTKTTSHEMVKSMIADAITGPSRGKNNELPPFSWSEQQGVLSGQRHAGVPETFDFEFTRMEPL